MRLAAFFLLPAAAFSFAPVARPVSFSVVMDCLLNSIHGSWVLGARDVSIVKTAWRRFLLLLLYIWTTKVKRSWVILDDVGVNMIIHLGLQMIFVIGHISTSVLIQMYTSCAQLFVSHMDGRQCACLQLKYLSSLAACYERKWCTYLVFLYFIYKQ